MSKKLSFSPRRSNKRKKEEKTKGEIKVSNFRGSPKVLKISKNDYYYLINREKYDITKIMMLIDYNRLSTLGYRFRAYPEGIDKIDFVSLLTKVLKTDKMPVNELTDLIYGIYKFFCEIDFNGDNKMEWAEFTQFIIDKVEGEHNNVEKEQDKTNKTISDKELMKYKRYELSRTIKDFHIHKTDIISTCYINKNNKLLINEYNTHLIKVYNPLIGKIEYNINIHELNDQGVNIKFSEFQKQLNYRKKYTVINFFATEVILAVLLSNKIIQFFCTFNFKEFELIFCVKTKSLQKRIWYLENHNMWISSGDKEIDEDYYYINQLDINFEIKSGIPIPITNHLIYKNKYCKISQHKDEIYDVIETKKPFLILTACLDGLIRLINVKDLEFLKTWKYHSSGVKHLDYNPNLESNGYILSTGFEYNVNIYCTDLSLDSAFKGKLEGHFVPLIDCKFINMTPICVSIDEEGNVRIWETVLRICLQSITNTKRNLTINGLLIMGKINKFVMFGNNLSFFEAKYKDQKDSLYDMNEENHPIKVSYNKYYQQFYVTTLNDIKIYNNNGSLDKRFKNIIENENFETDSKIKDLIFDNNYRKYYLGFSNGAIMQYNAGNGSLIKIINQIEYEKNGILFYKYQHYKDITKLYFYYSKNKLNGENILLFSSSLDSTIQIYDEREFDKSIKLRVYKGGHTLNRRKCEILCMDYNFNLSQLATGSAYGLIIIWDFDSSKIDDTLYLNHKVWGIKLDVLYVKYLNSYPLLFSSYSEGICILWTVKPLKGEPVIKFQNFYLTLYKIDVCDVTCCCFYENTIKNIEEKYLNKIYFVDEPEFIEERKKPRYDKNTKEKLPILTRESIEKESITDELLDPFFEEIKDNNNNINNNDDNAHNDDNEDKQNKEKQKNSENNYYLLICDKKGYMKVLNIKGVFRQYIKQKSNKIDYNTNFNLLKKEDVDVESTMHHLIKNSINRQKKIFEKLFTNLYSTRIINREWRGHFDYITDLCFIEDPVSTVSISKDKYLKIWNEKFELIGEIDIFLNESNSLNKYNFLKDTNVEWGFKVNETKLLEKEVNEIVHILENIDIPEETKIKKGSEIDKDFNDPQKYEIDEKEGLIKKRPKQVIVEEDKNLYRLKFDFKKFNNMNNNKDNNDFHYGYEAILLKNISNKIESIIQNKPSNEGLGEISNNIMTSVIEKKRPRKVKVVKKFSAINFESNKSNNLINSYKDNKRGGSRHSSLIQNKKFLYKAQSQKYLIFSNQNSQNGDMTPKPIKFANYFNIVNNESQKSSRDKKPSNQNKYLDENITIEENEKKLYKTINVNNKNDKYPKFNRLNQIKKNSYTSDKTKKIEKKLNNTFSDISSGMGNKNKTLYSINRNHLYAESFAHKPFYDIKKKSILPNIKYKYLNEKIKINNIHLNLNYEVREKTDDLIKNQYYLNNYKNLCKINPHNSDFSTVKSNFYNCKNIWNDIHSFIIDLKEKEDKKRNTLNNFSRNKIIFKSKSALDIKNDNQI